MDRLQVTLTQLAEILSNYPITMFFLYLIAWFYPIAFSRMACLVLAALCVWGLYSHFDENFGWYLDMLNRFGILKIPADVTTATEAHNYARGVYHAMAVAIALGLIMVPIFSARRRHNRNGNRS